MAKLLLRLPSAAAQLGGCPVHAVDYSNPEDLSASLASALEGVGDLRGCAYAVGSITLKPLRSTKPSDYLNAFTLNAVSAAELLKAATPLMKKSGGGSAVLFSTVAVQSGFANHAVVSAAKGAVEGLSRALAAELAPISVRVNCVAPSLTGGGSAMAAPMLKNEKAAAAIAASHPLGRLGTPEDSAALAAFLLSDEAAWITGQVLGVDGGRSSLR